MKRKKRRLANSSVIRPVFVRASELEDLVQIESPKVSLSYKPKETESIVPVRGSTEGFKQFTPKITTCFVLSAAQVENLVTEQALPSKTELLCKLLEYVETLGPVDRRRGSGAAAALGASGKIFLGYSLTFEGTSVVNNIHAERFVLALAAQHREVSLCEFAVASSPCGDCRQLLNELPWIDNLSVIIDSIVSVPGRRRHVCSLKSLLPFSFGPSDLGISPETRILGNNAVYASLKLPDSIG